MYMESFGFQTLPRFLLQILLYNFIANIKQGVGHNHLIRNLIALKETWQIL